LIGMQAGKSMARQDMIELRRTDSGDAGFVELVRHLDAELVVRDGDEHSYYAQFNKIDALQYVVVGYLGERAVSCGAVKEFSDGELEVKRMFTDPAVRGRGIAAAVLAELENWARELGYTACVLETGWKQPEAIALYRKAGYEQIPNYGPYIGMDNSVCFRKGL
jgi:putative acetyltransferase